MKFLVLLVLLPISVLGQSIRGGGGGTIAGGGTGGGGGNATNISMTGSGLATVTTNSPGSFNVDVSFNAISNLANNFVITATNYLNQGLRSLYLENLPTVNKRLQNHLPLRVWMFGDDAIPGGGNQFLTAVVTNLNTFMVRNGGIQGDGSWLYSGWNSQGTFEGFSGFNANWQPGTYYLATGGRVTNLMTSGTGFYTTRISVPYMSLAGLGTITVSTQSYIGGVLGTLGTVGTIDANAGSLKWNWTNIDIPLTAVPITVQLSSSGSNIVWQPGQYSTNANAGFVFDTSHGSGGDWSTLMATAVQSNYLRNMLSNYDLVIISDKGSPAGGSASFESMVASGLIPCDIVYIVSAPTTNATTVANLTERSNFVYIAQFSGRPIVDVGALAWPVSPELQTWMYTDAVHWSAAMCQIGGTWFAKTMGWNWSDQVGNLWTNRFASAGGGSGGTTVVQAGANVTVTTNSATDYTVASSGGAPPNVAYTNVAQVFSGQQTFNGGIQSTGTFAIQGTAGAFTVYNRAGSGAAYDQLFLNGQGLGWYVAGDFTHPILAITNNGAGGIALVIDASFTRTADLGRYYGNSGSLTNDPMEVISVTGTNFSIDWSKDGGFLTMAGNYALTNISNLSSNNIRHEYWLYTTQDGTGGRTFTNQNGLVQWPNGTNGYVPITTNAGRTDRIIFSTSRYQTNVYGSQDFNRY